LAAKTWRKSMRQRIEHEQKIVVVHLRDAVRTISERDASFLKRGDLQCDVRTAKIVAAFFEVGRTRRVGRSLAGALDPAVQVEPGGKA
jgi:hypothetical protein